MPLHVYATKVSLPALDPAVRVHRQRRRGDEGLDEHLGGFAEYVTGEGERPMTPPRFALVQHILRVRHHLSLDVPEGALEDFSEWLTAANAVCLSPDGAVRDPRGRVLAGPEDGEPEPGARVPHPADASMAKGFNESQLRTMGLEDLPDLPPGPGEEETVMQPPGEITARTWALQEKLRALPAPPVELVETVALLQWATSMVSILALPLHLSEPAEVLRRFEGVDRHGFVSEPDVRPLGELLSQLDLHHRLLWIVGAAAQEGAPPPAALEPEVVAARHAALEWITGMDDT